MKTNFTILWIDDNKDFVESLRTPLVDWMEQHGFSIDVAWHESREGMFDDLRRRQIELIVIDYKLPKTKGDVLVRLIRRKNYYQDIIFYSQDDIPPDLFKSWPDGVFFVAKGDAKKRIKDLLELRINRASEMATLRGWVVADSIELEDMLGRVLAKCFKGCQRIFAERVLAAEHNIFDFGKKHAVLSGILKDEIKRLQKRNPPPTKLQDLRELKKILDSFPDEIINVRNTLAHQVAELLAGGRFKVKKRAGGQQEIVIDHAACIKMRKDIRKHRDNLVALQDHIRRR